MCGIAGILAPIHQNPDSLTDKVASMTSALRLRGPDDDGSWIDGDAGIALGHRRLAVIDLSATGHQPMHSSCGRYVASYNGEIYNFAELRHELEGHTQAFRGQSDTEVILAAVAKWGVTGAVTRLDGMFAIALWDRSERSLHLVRDRLGEKPLCYGWVDGNLLFASTLAAIEGHPAFTRKISRDALNQFFRYGYVPAPHSIYDGIFKLPPGCILTLRANQRERPASFSPFPSERSTVSDLSPVRYWSALEAAQAGLANPFSGDDNAAADRLDVLLRASVARRMVADVPIGALLSGGVDSSVVSGMMQAQSRQRIRTFTIGFGERAFNEADQARAVATHLGTEHTELYLEPTEALDIIARLPAIYDEPFADASQIPTSLVSALVRRHVTVALSGDGGDELFAGYNRYPMGESIWRRVSWIPAPIRQLGAHLLRGPDPGQWDRVAKHVPLMPASYGTHGTAGDKFHKLADVLDMPDADALYERLVTIWPNPDSVTNHANGTHAAAHGQARSLTTQDIVLRMMFLDLVGYLPDDILTKVDRASMSVSLEVRVPLLDHKVVEFAWSLPRSMKLRGGTSKHVLKRVLHRYIPQELIDRPKRGFGVPLAVWLRGPLRSWAESLLDERALAADGLLNPGPIRAQWQEHLSGTRNWQGSLWCVLMFQAWRRSHQAVA